MEAAQKITLKAKLAKAIRAVIGTNVFVSGIFWSGPPSMVLEAWSKSFFKMIVSSEILVEYERALTSLAKKAIAGSSPSLQDRTRRI